MTGSGASASLETTTVATACEGGIGVGDARTRRRDAIACRVEIGAVFASALQTVEVGVYNAGSRGSFARAAAILEAIQGHAIANAETVEARAFSVADSSSDCWPKRAGNIAVGGVVVAFVADVAQRAIPVSLRRVLVAHARRGAADGVEALAVA